MVASLCKSKNLQNSLRSLTISDVYFPNILKSMPKFRYLTHLSLVKITISRPTFKSSPLVLPSSLLSLWIKDWALCPNSFFPVQVQQLSLLSNSYALLSSKLGFDLPNHPLTKSLTFDDSLLALLPESYPSLVQKFPGLKKLCYFKCAGLEQIKHKIQLPADPLKCLFEAASKKSCPPKVTVIDNPPKVRTLSYLSLDYLANSAGKENMHSRTLRLHFWLWCPAVWLDNSVDALKMRLKIHFHPKFYKWTVLKF